MIALSKQPGQYRVNYGGVFKKEFHTSLAFFFFFFIVCGCDLDVYYGLNSHMCRLFQGPLILYCLLLQALLCALLIKVHWANVEVTYKEEYWFSSNNMSVTEIGRQHQRLHYFGHLHCLNDSTVKVRIVGTAALLTVII